MTDIETVRECLCHWKSFAQGFRYAGLMEKLRETEAALEALARIAQPSFLSDYPHSPKPEQPEQSTPGC